MVLPLVVLGLVVVRRVGTELEERAYQRLSVAERAVEVLLADEAGHAAERTRAAAAALAPRLTEGAPAVQAAVADVRRAQGLDVLVVGGEGGQVMAADLGEAAFAQGHEPPAPAVLLRPDPVPGVTLARAPVIRVDGSRAAEVVGGGWVDSRLLARFAVALDVDFTVVDGDRVVASSLTGTDLDRLPVTDRFRTSLDGEEALVVAGDLPGGGARLLTSITRGPVLAPRATATWIFILALGAVLAGIVLAVVVAVAAVSGPVGVLADAAERMAGGDLGHRVQISSPREAAALGRAFNAIADDLERQRHELERNQGDFRRAVDRLGDALAAGHDLTAVVDVVLETSALTLGADAAVLYTTPGMRAPLTARAAYGAATETRLAAGEGLPGLAAERDRVVVWPGDAVPAPEEPTAVTAMAIPVHSRGRLFGVLGVYRRTSRRFGGEDAAILQALVRQAETAIDNVFLHQEAERLSITDGLTGVWNRRLFDLRVSEVVAESGRFGDPFGLVLLDIDNFKQINDQYGHQTGDAVLVELAARVSEVIREADKVARYGGEEFVLLLPRTDLRGAMSLAQKVRDAVCAEPFNRDAMTVDVTVSLGVACYPEHGTGVQELIGAADDALYRAKAHGKNRVERARAGADRLAEGGTR